MKTLLIAFIIVIAVFAAIWLPRPAGVEAYTPTRTEDGKPDLQGIWQARSSAAFDLQDHGGSVGIPAGKGVVAGNEIPYQPWAVEKKKENFKNRAATDPLSK